MNSKAMKEQNTDLIIHKIFHISNFTWVAVFLISLYGTPLAQRASYLAQHSSLFGPDGAVNCDYIITNSINQS